MLLTLENVSKTFGGLRAVHRVTAGVAEGEILGLIGPNGAGKTTLFNLISRRRPAHQRRIVFQGAILRAMAPTSAASAASRAPSSWCAPSQT